MSAGSLVTASGLRVRFDDVVALDGVDLEVARGEVHAIVGLNGAGKTTLMRSILGMVVPAGGHLAVLGTVPRTARRDTWSRVGHMVDRPFGYPELSVTENIVASGRLHGLGPEDAARRATSWIERLELAAWAERRARTLSLGNRQRLGLACVLAHDPRLVVLDEPTNALDPAGVLTLRDVVLDQRGRGAGVLVSSHHLDEVSRIADRISVLHAGRVIGGLRPGTAEIERAFFRMVHAYDRAHGRAA
jgi:ABC-2 type transport system ATP-binding protein